MLIVDDKTEFRYLLKLFLSNRYEIETAGNIVQAVALLYSGYVPDLIVSDKLPVDNDTELVKQLWSNEAFKHIPVLILSNNYRSLKMNEWLEAKNGNIPDEAFDPEQLLERLEKILAN